jgi:hypothetical protein
MYAKKIHKPKPQHKFKINSRKRKGLNTTTVRYAINP